MSSDHYQQVEFVVHNGIDICIEIVSQFGHLQCKKQMLILNFKTQTVQEVFDGFWEKGNVNISNFMTTFLSDEDHVMRLQPCYNYVNLALHNCEP